MLSWRRRRWQLEARLSYEHREAERLKELDTLKARLYTNITHEFRTPLTMIMGLADQLYADAGEEVREKLAVIQRNSFSLLRLIRQMLDLSKLESGLMPLHLICGDIVPFLRYQVESFHSLAESQGLRLEFHPAFSPLVMDFDPDKMETIVWNLISNAMKFTSIGSIELSVSLDEKSNLILQVKDTGMGIPPENLPYIFDRFYQAGQKGHRWVEGTGIGLALTKELVKLHGGDISVKSELGAGTEFLVMLPVTRSAVWMEGEALPSGVGRFQPLYTTTGISNGNEANPSPGAPILLIVEDNADVRFYLRSLLQHEYQIEISSDGANGLAKAFDLVPDIILSDVMMPGMDGLALCKTLKSDIRTSHIPIVLLTAKGDMDSRIDGLQHGADAYLAKPFQKEELFAQIQNLIELRRRLQERYLNVAAGLKQSDAHTLEDGFIRQVRGILEAHLGDEEFDIAKLCKTLGMSRTQLYRKFQALTDQPIARYFRTMRLSMAQELLLTTDLQIAEIAFRVGFKDPANFTRAFGDAFGVSPGSWRKDTQK